MYLFNMVRRMTRPRKERRKKAPDKHDLMIKQLKHIKIRDLPDNLKYKLLRIGDIRVKRRDHAQNRFKPSTNLFETLSRLVSDEELDLNVY